jgi:CDGSH-type Zn-finger protein/uncharacterized Fe-S cluster protein YjdI
MSEDVSKYEGKDIDVTYHRRLCIHAAECGRGSSEVFNPKSRPWINPDAAPADEVARIVSRCPTGALQFERKDGGPQEETPSSNRITVAPDGPLYVKGEVVIKSADGSEEPTQTRLALCRCGASKLKPYCDGSHSAAEFHDSGAVNGDPEPLEAEGGALTITVLKDGPLILAGNVTLRAASGRRAFAGTKGALCRCGASANKPFCDGSHKTVGFTAE